MSLWRTAASRTGPYFDIMETRTEPRLCVRGVVTPDECRPFLCLYFQTSKDQFVKVQFNKFLLGNYSDGCPNDYVDVNGRRLINS